MVTFKDAEDWIDKEVPAAATAIKRGGIQGATFGFSDEMAGFFEALADDPVATALHMLTDPEAGAAKIGESYRRGRDISRQMDEEAKAASPYVYFGAEMAGGLAPILATGGSAASGAIVRTPSLLARAAEGVSIGAKYGAATGLGHSTAEDVGGMARDIGIGGAAGGAIGGIAGAAIPPAATYLNKVVTDVKEALAKRAWNKAQGNLFDIKLTQLVKVETPEDMAAFNALRKAGHNVMPFGETEQGVAQRYLDLIKQRGGPSPPAGVEVVAPPYIPKADAEIQSRAAGYLDHIRPGWRGTKPSPTQEVGAIEGEVESAQAYLDSLGPAGRTSPAAATDLDRPTYLRNLGTPRPHRGVDLSSEELDRPTFIRRAEEKAKLEQGDAAERYMKALQDRGIIIPEDVSVIKTSPDRLRPNISDKERLALDNLAHDELQRLEARGITGEPATRVPVYQRPANIDESKLAERYLKHLEKQGFKPTAVISSDVSALPIKAEDKEAINVLADRYLSHGLGKESTYKPKRVTLTVHPGVGKGMLTIEEHAALQEIADRFGTTIDVVGSRAAGKGRYIDEATRPVGKQSYERSDIDIRHSPQVDIDSEGMLSGKIKNIEGAEPRSQFKETPDVPYIRFTPKKGSKVITAAEDRGLNLETETPVVKTPEKSTPYPLHNQKDREIEVVFEGEDVVPGEESTQTLPGKGKGSGDTIDRKMRDIHRKVFQDKIDEIEAKRISGKTLTEEEVASKIAYKRHIDKINRQEFQSKVDQVVGTRKGMGKKGPGKGGEDTPESPSTPPRTPQEILDDPTLDWRQKTEEFNRYVEADMEKLYFENKDLSQWAKPYTKDELEIIRLSKQEQYDEVERQIVKQAKEEGTTITSNWKKDLKLREETRKMIDKHKGSPAAAEHARDRAQHRADLQSQRAAAYPEDAAKAERIKARGDRDLKIIRDRDSMVYSKEWQDRVVANKKILDDMEARSKSIKDKKGK